MQITWSSFDPAVHALWLHVEGRTGVHALVVDAPTPGGWRLQRRTFATERAVLDAGDAPLQLVVIERASRKILGAEPLALAPSFFADLRDRLAYFNGWPYRRPGRLAAFTQVCNDGAMLPLFLRHYGRFCDPGGLYVINHGSAPAQIDPFRGQAVVVDIPRGETDQLHIANFCGHFQRFLLLQYDWVIHVDSDELLLCSRPDGDLRALLDELPAGSVLRPATGYDLTHDPDHEPAMDWGRPLSRQRSRLFPNDSFCKPALASAPVSWTIGFHQCLEPSQAHDALCMVHLRDADLDHAVQRELKWAELARSRFDRDVVMSGQPLAGRAGLHRRFAEQARHADTVAMPDWMRDRF